MSLYRLYRPQTLADLVGQDSLCTILKNAAIYDAFSHAYLFYGPRGTGKTSTARILAKLVNCQTRATDPEFKKKGEPCGVCDACIHTEAGNALDIIEIDAASNRGIDEIRNLKESISSLPAQFSKKVFIIDEVHMLTTQAFNALLKTLEEPPAHAILILATTEYEKIPATIISRTQRFHFKKLTLAHMVSVLETIIKKEKILCELPALELIASLADGSMRDAISLLDQMVSMRDNTITVSDIEALLGKTDRVKVWELSNALITKDTKIALKLLYEIHNEGHNLFQLNKDVLEYIRRTLALSINPDLNTLFSREIAHSELDSIKKHTASIDASYAVSLIKALLEAQTNMKYNPLPLIAFEVAIIEATKKI
jgi:DNA polymerase-3 subunit gamma/tau